MILPHALERGHADRCPERLRIEEREMPEHTSTATLIEEGCFTPEELRAPCACNHPYTGAPAGGFEWLAGHWGDCMRRKLEGRGNEPCTCLNSTFIVVPRPPGPLGRIKDGHLQRRSADLWVSAFLAQPSRPIWEVAWETFLEPDGDPLWTAEGDTPKPGLVALAGPGITEAGIDRGRCKCGWEGHVHWELEDASPCEACGSSLLVAPNPLSLAGPELRRLEAAPQGSASKALMRSMSPLEAFRHTLGKSKTCESYLIFPSPAALLGDLSGAGQIRREHL